MASKQIFEEVYTQTNIILCIKPPKDLATYHSAMRDRDAVSLLGYKCRGVAKNQAQPMD